jgi:hypothetical protein
MTLDEVNLEIARQTYLLNRRTEQLEKALRSAGVSFLSGSFALTPVWLPA